MTIGDEKVLRYRLVFECSMDDSGGHMDARKDGEWVEYSAYAELAAENHEWSAQAMKQADRAEKAESQLAELRATLQGIADADYRKWDDGVNTPFAFVDWAKSRAAHAIRILAAADGG